MNKTQRNYKMVYTAPPSDSNTDPIEITIKYPIGLELDVKRDTFASSNTASFRVFNLSKSTREKIFQDRFNINRFCFVDLYAGYEDNMPLIFRGKVLEAYSNRSNTEVITDIQALDNDIINSYSSHTFEADTPKKDILSALVADMPNIQLGAIGTLDGNIPTRTVFDDLTFTAINKLTGDQVFIDNGKLNLLRNNECIGDVGIYKITSATGLIGTPRRRDAMLELDVVFAPEITVGQLVEIDDPILSEFNGQYKVLGIHHHGIIDSHVNGELTTTLSLFIGALLPNSNSVLTGSSIWQPVSMVKNNKVEPLDNASINSIRAVRQTIIRTGRIPHTKITSNIWWDEVIQNYSKQGSVPSLDVMSNLYSVAHQLQAFIDKYYPNNRVTITSGWRSRSYNATIAGAARNSAHITGQALDFYLPGQSLVYVYRYIKPYWGNRCYLNSRQGIIHVDTAIEKGPIPNDR